MSHKQTLPTIMKEEIKDKPDLISTVENGIQYLYDKKTIKNNLN
jgi:hypothetical protein